MARLIVNPRTPQARPILLKQGVNKLGRREDNDFTIDDPSVSSMHCEVILSGGAVRVRDVGSTNGTFINGVQVTEVTLAPDQHIQIGNVTVLFEADEPVIDRVVDAPQAPPSPKVRMTAAPPAAPAIRVSLSTAAQAPAPAAVEEPPVNEEPATIALPPNTKCKFHYRAFAHFVCTRCRRPLCDLCVSSQPTATGHQAFCKSCGVVAMPVRVTIEAPPEKSFSRELRRALAYPFRGKGVLVLIVAAMIFGALDLLTLGLRVILGIFGIIIGMVINAVAVGGLFSYAQNIINATAIGDDEPPDLPGLEDLWGNLFKLLGVTLASFGPALVVAYFAISQELPAAGIALIPAVIFGCFYFPMAFLAVAINDNVMSCNPLVVVPSILKVPVEYVVTVILVGGVFGLRWLGDAVSGSLIGPSLFTTSMLKMFFLFSLRALWALLSIYLLTVTMRILGLLYATKKDRLGW
jgi:hypothetical protein